MGRWLAVGMIILLFTQSVSAIEPGVKRRYSYDREISTGETEIYRDQPEVYNIGVGGSGSGPQDVEFQQFVESDNFDVPVPQYYLDDFGEGKLVVVDTPVIGYGNSADRTCPSTSTGTNWTFNKPVIPYWMGENMESCLRENMYSASLTPVFSPETFPQNKTIARRIATEESPDISVEQPFTLVGLDEPVFTYNAHLSFFSGDDRVRYSLTAELEVDRSKLISRMFTKSPLPSAFGVWEVSQEVEYDQKSGWMLYYQDNLTMEYIHPSNTSSALAGEYRRHSFTMEYRPDYFASTPITEIFIGSISVFALLPILAFVRKMRRKRVVPEVEMNLYPEDEIHE